MSSKANIDFKGMQKILRKNGYVEERSRGSHHVYFNGKNKIVINLKLNCMVAGRIIKKNELVV